MVVEIVYKPEYWGKKNVLEKPDYSGIFQGIIECFPSYAGCTTKPMQWFVCTCMLSIIWEYGGRNVKGYGYMVKMSVVVVVGKPQKWESQKKWPWTTMGHHLLENTNTVFLERHVVLSGPPHPYREKLLHRSCWILLFAINVVYYDLDDLSSPAHSHLNLYYMYQPSVEKIKENQKVMVLEV